MEKRVAQDSGSASARIDARIVALGDWRGETLARLRVLIVEAVPDVVETVKWVKPTNPHGVPVWERPAQDVKAGGAGAAGGGGIICTGEVYRDKVKLTFAKGASLVDPAGLFNASLDGGTRRAIDVFEGDVVDGEAFVALVRAAAG